MKFAYFTLVNNVNIFAENTKKFFAEKNEDIILIQVDDNVNRQYGSIRHWINEKLDYIYANESKFKDCFVFFIHQDVCVSANFQVQVSQYLSKLKQENIAVIGFAGIDLLGNPHMIIKDSGVFSFHGDSYPTEVDSVDELCFGVSSDFLIANNVKLSSLAGWHAYSVEFSILASIHSLKTFVLPIFMEHNSTRSNNNGLLKCHIELYNLYHYSIKTLVGDVKQYSMFGLISRQMQSFYNNYVKFKLNPTMSMYFKHVLFDLSGIKPNKTRILHYLLKRRNSEIIYVDCNQIKIDSFNFELDNCIINFRHVDTSHLNKFLSSNETNIFVLGYSEKIVGLHYCKRFNLNYKIK